MQEQLKEHTNLFALNFEISVIMNKVTAEELQDGFQSDEEVHQEHGFERGSIVQLEAARDLSPDLKLHLPPAAELAVPKRHSLYPDMIFGWKPKTKLSKPIPIYFEDDMVDELIGLQPPAKLLYLGKRPVNSYEAHSSKDYEFPYPHLKKALSKKRFPFQGMAESAKSCLQFDSDFQSGNLDAVVCYSPTDYDLFIRVDTNTRGHRQWFNFRVRSQSKGCFKFNIWGFKGKNLFSRGMRPYGESSRGGGWRQIGNKVRWSRKSLKFRYKNNQDIFDDRNYNRLTFEYSFEQNQTVQIAYCVPYTYSRVVNLVESLRPHPFVQVTRLCNSLSGLNVPLLALGDPNSPFRKRTILLSGRAHPGQSNGSLMVQGFLKTLVSGSKEAQFLLKHIQFKIIPMLNPDGVTLGNYRTGLTGRDFNRMFLDPEEEVHPEVFSLKEEVKRLKKECGKDLLMFLDLHGHSVKKNVFMYGPQFSISEKQYYESKVFPKLLASKTQMFRFYSCIFRLSECKHSTARGVLMKKLRVPYCYTIEASNGFYYSTECKQDCQFNEQLFINMGAHIVSGIYSYVEALLSAQELLKQRVLARQRKLSPKKVKTIEQPKDGLIAQLVEQIKEDQLNKVETQQRKSDDAISEGSSDSQSKSQDLSEDKIANLLNAIRTKPKKKVISISSSKRGVSEVKVQAGRVEAQSSEVSIKRNGKPGFRQSSNRQVVNLPFKPFASPINFTFTDQFKSNSFVNAQNFVQTAYPTFANRQRAGFRHSVSPMRIKAARALRMNSFVLDRRL